MRLSQGTRFRANFTWLALKQYYLQMALSQVLDERRELKEAWAPLRGWNFEHQLFIFALHGAFGHL